MEGMRLSRVKKSQRVVGKQRTRSQRIRARDVRSGVTGSVLMLRYVDCG